MEFAEVVARRRMVRRYRDHPVDEAVIHRALIHATHAPSAGFTQGWSFLVLRTPADVARFWESTGPGGSNPWLDGMRTAPVVIVVLASEAAYRDRYSEPDKASATGRAAEMPWWQIDAGMAALLILQTATDEGLGACFFGVPAAGIAGLRHTFGIPEDIAPIGAITLGHPDLGGSPGSGRKRPRLPIETVAHEGHWDRAFGGTA